MRKIRTADIPQADDLGKVLEVVSAVSEGATSYQRIAQEIGVVERQGRYYRLAAEIVGLIRRTSRNKVQLTETGQGFVKAGQAKKKAILADAIAGTRLFQRVLPFLESKREEGCDRAGLRRFLKSVTRQTGPTMIPRRTHTIVSWLKHAGLVRQRGGRFFLEKFPKGASVAEYASIEEPLIPRTFALSEYRETARRAKAVAKSIKYSIDQTQVERASAVHEKLTALVAEKIRAAGGIPRKNQLIDLAARIRTLPFIIEVKSTSRENARAQVRRGLSQLYEYRYLQGIPDARLLLVVQHPLGAALEWLIDYLVKDRGILVAWDGDMRTLHCPRILRKELRFLL